jgi:hypothetical protein
MSSGLVFTHTLDAKYGVNFNAPLPLCCVPSLHHGYCSLPLCSSDPEINELMVEGVTLMNSPAKYEQALKVGWRGLDSRGWCCLPW